MSTERDRPIEPTAIAQQGRKSRVGLYFLGAAWIACWVLVLAQLVAS
jgi:hypothetical protein